MPDTTISYRGDKAKLLRFLKINLPRILAGREPDPFGLGKACLAKVVSAALNDVREDYLKKSQGGTGDDGVQWAPLDPSTVRKKAARGGQSGLPGRLPRRVSGAAKDGLRRVRAEIYRQEYQKLRLGGVVASEAKRQASLTARALTRSVWVATLAAAGRGIPGLGGTQPDVPTLIDTERLIESASPGAVSGQGLNASYEPNRVRGHDDQRVEYDQGGFAVYSDVPYGEFHATGTSKMPQRQWRYPDVPEEWVARWADVYAESVSECLPDVIPLIQGYNY